MRIQGFSDRTLNFLASMVSGQDARVVVSNRYLRPLSVAYNSQTILLHDQDSGLYDLFLGARLLQHREEYRWRFRHETYDADVSECDSAVRSWVYEAIHSLRHEFPRVEHLDGFHHPRRANLEPPALSWSEIGVRPLSSDEIVGGGVHDVAGISHRGADGDFQTLLEALAQGTYPTECVPELPELPVATIPYLLKTSEAFPANLELMERLVDSQSAKLARAAALTCFVEIAESMVEQRVSVRHYSAGMRINPSRLVQARIAAQTGQTPRPFRRRDHDRQPFFDPKQHVIVLGCALGGRLEPNLPMMVSYYLALDVDLIVIGYADRVVTLPNGRCVYLSVPVEIKGLDDPIDGAFWTRLLQLKEQGLKNLPGEPACFSPLMLRSLTRCIDSTVAGGNHRFCWLHMFSPTSVPFRDVQMAESAFYARTADQLDAQFEKLLRRDDDLEILLYFMHLNPILGQHARPGGIMASLDFVHPKVVRWR